MPRIFCTLVFTLLAACSAEQAYRGLQQGAQNDCALSAGRDAYEECMERTSMSYREYEQKRMEQDRDSG